ncbi:hypothetical protein [Natronorubrum sp. FCH18a]|uniref:hypothetical protein n=1 Tax=Natronorubrum sp. FCH18a TaxID=3447018 RepID=UPI003F5176E0
MTTRGRVRAAPSSRLPPVVPGFAVRIEDGRPLFRRPFRDGREECGGDALSIAVERDPPPAPVLARAVDPSPGSAETISDGLECGVSVGRRSMTDGPVR